MTIVMIRLAGAEAEMRYTTFGRRTGLRVSELDDNLAASALTLSDDQADRLDAVSALALGFPYPVLAPDRSGLRIAGGRSELLTPRFAPAA
jgi:hypothetical protein